jgi:hypothetical protein
MPVDITADGMRVKGFTMNGWLMFFVGLGIGWLLVPMLLNAFKARSA